MEQNLDLTSLELTNSSFRQPKLKIYLKYNEQRSSQVMNTVVDIVIDLLK